MASEAAQHVVAFAVLSALVMLTVRRRPTIVFGVVASGGVLGEFVQLATSNRSFGVADTALSVIGAGIGVALVRRSDWCSTVAVVASARLLIANSQIALEPTVERDSKHVPRPTSAQNAHRAGRSKRPE